MPNPGIFPGAQALMPQQLPRPEWSLREYGTKPASRIPPKPPFLAWVPPNENVVFGDAPRDMSRYQALPTSVVSVIQPAPPAPPKPKDQQPDYRLRKESDWALRDYTALQDVFSVLATPPLPPPNNQLPPQHNARPDWTLRDYASYQAMSAWFENNPVLNVIPLSDLHVFSEFERDMTPYQLLYARQTQPGAAANKPQPQLFIPPYFAPPYDLTAAQLVVSNVVLGTAFAGIPKVPLGGNFVAFDPEPHDYTPEMLVLATRRIPAAILPQIPPTYPPFIEWPGWSWGQYQALQDVFSAIGTPVKGAYPKGLVPQFTLEALIRDVSHPTSLYTVQNFRLPPPPPFVFAQAPTQVETPGWLWSNYQSYQDQFSAFGTLVPVALGFRVMAVTAGFYGEFRRPGDLFDILFAKDFSDSTKNYQTGGGEFAAGWMVKVGTSQPFLLTDNNQPLNTEAGLNINPQGTTAAPDDPNRTDFPIVDPNRRFVM